MQMVGFVLNRACQEAAAPERNGVSFSIERFHIHHLRPDDIREYFGEAETSLWPGRRFADRRDLWIDQNDRHELMHISGRAVQFERGWAVRDSTHIDDRQLERYPHLLSRQAHPFVRV